MTTITDLTLTTGTVLVFKKDLDNPSVRQYAFVEVMCTDDEATVSVRVLHVLSVGSGSSYTCKANNTIVVSRDELSALNMQDWRRIAPRRP